MRDGNGGISTATADITVNPINDIPVAVDDTFNTDEDVAVTGTVLPNDSDIDGDTLSIRNTAIVDPSNGTLLLNNDGTFTYTPDTSFFGSDSFVYEVRDGKGGTGQATVNICLLYTSPSPRDRG